MEVEARWKWKLDGSGSSMEVEARWQWKLHGSGSSMEVEAQQSNRIFFGEGDLSHPSVLKISSLNP